MTDHFIDVLKISRDEDIGAGVAHWEAGARSNVEAGAVGGKGGEHSVKRFMNIKVKSSKEEVKVHAKNDLVSETMKLSKLNKKIFLKNFCSWCNCICRNRSNCVYNVLRAPCYGP